MAIYRGINFSKDLTVYAGTGSITLSNLERTDVRTTESLKRLLEAKAGRSVRTPIYYHRLRGGVEVVETGKNRTTAEVQAEYDADRKR